MPDYNVTFTTTFTSEVSANTSDEAIRAIELISNDDNNFDISIVSVEEILPPPVSTQTNEYVSLRSFHSTPQQENETTYNAFVSPTTASSSYTRLVPSIR